MQKQLIACWAHPRSLSTVTERVFIERGDLHVIHEPFSYLYYVLEGKGTATINETDATKPKDYPAIREQILRSSLETPTFFKDMPHHCFNHVMQDEAFLLAMDHIFLIREPSQAIESHYAKNPEVTLEEIGYEHQYKLFEKVRELKGAVPAVIEADDLQADPKGTIQALCQWLGLTFIPESLSWQQGQRKEWKNWEKWHEDAANSTGIVKMKKAYASTVENHKGLQAYYQHHLPYYEKMAAFRLAR